MRAMIILRFPEQRTFSPERVTLPLTYGLPVWAEVRYPRVIADAFAESHTDTQVEFRGVLLPQAAMVKALQTGNVRAIYDDKVWKVQESTQENDNSLTLTAEYEKPYVAPPSTVQVDGEDAEAGDDVLGLRTARQEAPQQGGSFDGGSRGGDSTDRPTGGGTGAQGPQGEQGPPGPQGPQGERGPAGATGPPGPQGEQGPQGEPGSGGEGGGLNQAQMQAVVLAAVADEAEQGNTDRWPKSKLPADTTYGVTQGPQGPQGEQGPKGDKGDKGDPGQDGTDGAPGAPGTPGARGERGPQGEQGQKGDTGDTGPQGNPGAQGDKGDTGDTGPQGPQGNPGPAGPAQSNANIDARIAAFARTGATVNIPDARLPTILRGLPGAFGTRGQILQVNSGATALEFADAPSGGGGGTGISVTQEVVDWGNTDRSLATPATRTFSAWTTLTSPTLRAGHHILTFRMLIQENATAWIVIEYRLQRTRNSVTTTIEEVPLLRYNARPGSLTGDLAGAGLFQSVTIHFESIAGDTFNFQARGATDQPGNIGNAINFPAASQQMEMTTFA